MWLSFLKKVNKNEQYITLLENIPKYVKISNRELQLDNLTPQIAESIDSYIRFWNIADDEMCISLSQREPIKIYINSIGGSLDAAMTIMNSIQISKTPVYTFNIGSVHKESFLVYLAGHRRYTYYNSTFMYTDTIFSKLIEEENESSFYNKNNVFISMQNNIKTILIEKLGITEAQYNKHNKNEWWFSSDDAIKLHICNEILRSHYYYIKKDK